MNFFKRKYYQLKTSFLRRFGSNDLEFIKSNYYLKNNRKLELDNPREFTEKLQWLRLHLYNENYKDYVDKYEVRNYISKKIGDAYLNDLIGVYNIAEDLNFDELPHQFALKCTHGSGYNVIVKDKSIINIDDVKNRLNSYMSMNYYNKYKELIYKDIKPRIIAEKYLNQTDSEHIIDYKFYCVNGNPEYVLVKTNYNDQNHNCFYDLDWNKLESDVKISNYLEKHIEKPNNFDELIDIAKKLSEGFIFLRVDLYSINDKVYFGELTFFPRAGFKRLAVERLNIELGDKMTLPI
jgi:hypothetical protein